MDLGWSLVYLVILLAGGLGLTSIFKGFHGCWVEGFRGKWLLHIVGGVVIATPLGLLLWVVIYLHYHPFTLG